MRTRNTLTAATLLLAACAPQAELDLRRDAELLAACAHAAETTRSPERDERLALTEQIADLCERPETSSPEEVRELTKWRNALP